MPSGNSPWIGKLGLRLTLAFVAVALAAILAAFFIASELLTEDVSRLVSQQEADLTQAASVAAASAYDRVGWRNADLSPLLAIVAREGSGFRVRDLNGLVVRESPGFGFDNGGPELTKPVIVGGQRVGTVTVSFDHKGLGAAIQNFEVKRWQVRVSVTGVAILIALLVALIVSRRITLPVDRLIRAARAQGAGQPDARAGDVRGFGEIRELSLAFDQMADSLGQQDRLRRNLVADVAHELRTPIAVLQAGHEAMLDGVTQPTSEHLASLRDEVLRLARMVDDLQRLASAEAAAMQLKLVPHDLADVAATAADSLADSFDAADVSLVQHLRQVPVICDPLRMHEIAVNLLTNAMKFTPAGGTVVLETEQYGELARLRVTDTGVGIPPDELPRVSERFFRGHRSTDVAGSGIGLTIVDELVRAHHGVLELASTPGRGTQVTVTIPMRDRDGHWSDRQARPR